MKASRLILALAVGLLLLAQGDTERDDPDQEFPGQKMACNNFHDNAHKCNCALATDCEAHRQKNPNLNGDGNATMGSRCKTYCKRDHCHCLSPCTS